MKRIFYTFALVLSIALQLTAQEEKNDKDSVRYLKVYVDCMQCDKSYFSDNISLWEMVTELQSADVHLHITELIQAGGSTLNAYVFIGKNRFENLMDTLTFNVPADLSPDEKRSLQLDKMNIGLVPYIMKTPQANRIFLFTTQDAIQDLPKKDAWNNWIFDLYGMGIIQSQKFYTAKNLNLSLGISKITQAFKVESYSRIDYMESKYTLFDLDSTEHHINSYYKGISNQNLVVKSMGKHVGLGVIASYLSDQTDNLNHRYRVGPAIEYNIYPYHEALQKQFRFLYSCAYEQSNYYDLSIYNKMDDQGWRQSLSIMIQYNQPWGIIDARVFAANYLHEMSRYSMGGTVLTSIHVSKIRGLAINFSCGIYMYRDKINQAKGYASLEDLYTRQRAMETDYQSDFSFGISYRFGSKKFPPANPRFSH